MAPIKKWDGKSHIKKSDRAWLAGLYEGEGTVRHRPGTLTVRIASTDRDIVGRVHDLCGGNIRTEKRINGWKTMHTWELNGLQRVPIFMAMVLPWLGQRRREQWDKSLYDKAQDALIRTSTAGSAQ